MTFAKREGLAGFNAPAHSAANAGGVMDGPGGLSEPGRRRLKPD